MDDISIVDQPQTHYFSNQSYILMNNCTKILLTKASLQMALRNNLLSVTFLTKISLQILERNQLQHYFRNQKVLINNNDKQLSSYDRNQNLPKMQSYQFPGIHPPLSKFNFEAKFPKVEHRPSTGSSSNFQAF